MRRRVAADPHDAVPIDPDPTDPDSTDPDPTDRGVRSSAPSEGMPAPLRDFEAAAAVVRRRRRRRRRAIRTLVAVGAVSLAAAVLAASQAVGPRPSLGPRPDGSTGPGGPADVAVVPAEPSVGCTLGLPTAPGEVDRIRVRTARDGVREVRVTAPLLRTAGSDAPVPLLLAVPGFGQDADAFVEESGLERALPDWMVATIEPSAAGEINVAQDVGRPDDALLAVLTVEELQRTRCVDRSRTAVVGFGPGGQLAGALACIRPTDFVAAVSVHGAFLPDPCELDPAVSFLGVWAADDDVLPIGGGYGVGLPRVAPAPPGAPPVQRVPAEPADTITTRWADEIGAGERSVLVLGDRSVTTRFAGGRLGTVAESWIRAGRGHGWAADDTTVVADFLRARARPS
jgi:poly(3-hydroxybutyrate) depolymerase